MEPPNRRSDVEWEIVGLSRFYSRNCIPDSLWICQPSVGVPFFEAVQLFADSQSPTHTPSKQNTEKQHRHHRDWTDNRHIRWKNHDMKTQPLVTCVYFPSFPSQICSGDRSDIKVAQFAMSSAIQGGSNSQVLPCLPWPLIAPKAGYVAEHSAYHHGSLDSNITNHDLNGDKFWSLLWWVATFDLLRSYFC